jgi:hypothetical protein
VDNIRLWNVAESAEDSWSKTKSAVQFKIIPGHHGGYISQMRESLRIHLTLSGSDHVSTQLLILALVFLSVQVVTVGCMAIQRKQFLYMILNMLNTEIQDFLFLH